MTNYNATNYAVANWATVVIDITEGAFLRGTSQIKKVIRVQSKLGRLFEEQSK